MFLLPFLKGGKRTSKLFDAFQKTTETSFCSTPIQKRGGELQWLKGSHSNQVRVYGERSPQVMFFLKSTIDGGRL